MLAGEAGAHKRLTVIALELLCARFLIACFHLILLICACPRCRLRCFFGLCGETFFMNAFRSSPVPSPNPLAVASALHVFISFC
jgi:hypothetical protein